MSYKPLPLQISDVAYEELVKIRASLHLDEQQGLRIGVKGSSPAGSSFLLGFDYKEPLDEVYQYKDLTVFIHKAHSMYLVGLLIDYVKEEGSAGFTFRTP